MGSRLGGRERGQGMGKLIVNADAGFSRSGQLHCQGQEKYKKIK